MAEGDEEMFRLVILMAGLRLINMWIACTYFGRRGPFHCVILSDY